MVMEPDLALVIGIFLAWFAIPSMVSAFSDSRAPRVSAVMMVIALGLVLYALSTRPGGYDLADIPHVFVSVIARIFG